MKPAPHPRFSWFTDDFAVIGSRLDEDIRDVWMRKYSPLMTGGITYVNGKTGSDTAGTGATWAHAFRTIDKALRETNSGEIHLWPGQYQSTGYRVGDTHGDRPKMLRAPFGGVTITTPGDRLSDASSIPNARYPTVMETWLSTPNHVVRLLSSALDEFGAPWPIPRYNDVEEVEASGYGWWYDAASKTLFTRLDSLAGVSAVYAVGGDNSLVITSRLYLENITLDVYPFVIGAKAECWMRGCTIRYSEAAGVQVSGGRSYSQDCILYRNKGDLYNYDGVSPCGAELFSLGAYPGDPDTFGRGVSQPSNLLSTAQNKNVSSAHSGSVVRIGCKYYEAFGPVVADTDGSYSWHIACDYSRSLATGASRYGSITQGPSAKAWFDGCTVAGGGLNADNGAEVFLHLTEGRRTATNGGVFREGIA